MRTFSARHVLPAALSLIGACATPAPAPSGPASAADQALAQRISLALNADPWYLYSHVDVRVDDGVANLSGYVWSTDALYQARRIAAHVPGVTGVVTNHLELERNGIDNSPVSR